MNEPGGGRVSTFFGSDVGAFVKMAYKCSVTSDFMPFSITFSGSDGSLILVFMCESLPQAWVRE